MKQLTHAEKQQLEAKIKDEKERQQALRENNPDLPETFEGASAKTGFFVWRQIWKYGFLAVILGLLAWNVINLLRWRNFDYDQYGGSVIGLMLLFNHIAYYFTKTGWKSRVMKMVAWVWTAFGLVYMFWVFR